MLVPEEGPDRSRRALSWRGLFGGGSRRIAPEEHPLPSPTASPSSRQQPAAAREGPAALVCGRGSPAFSQSDGDCSPLDSPSPASIRDALRGADPKELVWGFTRSADEVAAVQGGGGSTGVVAPSIAVVAAARQQRPASPPLPSSPAGAGPSVTDCGAAAGGSLSPLAGMLRWATMSTNAAFEDDDPSSGGLSGGGSSSAAIPAAPPPPLPRHPPIATVRPGTGSVVWGDFSPGVAAAATAGATAGATASPRAAGGALKPALIRREVSSDQMGPFTGGGAVTPRGVHGDYPAGPRPVRDVNALTAYELRLMGVQEVVPKAPASTSGAAAPAPAGKAGLRGLLAGGRSVNLPHVPSQPGAGVPRVRVERRTRSRGSPSPSPLGRFGSDGSAGDASSPLSFCEAQLRRLDGGSSPPAGGRGREPALAFSSFAPVPLVRAH